MDGKKAPKILVTGAGALLGQGIIRSIRCSSFSSTIIAADPSPLSAGLYWADRACLVPLASSPQYPERMEKLIQREKPDLILVGTDVELEFFAAHRQELERRFETHIVVSSSRVVSIADDKYLTFKFLKDNGFPAPESVLPGEELSLVKRFGFPLIVKPRRGARSVGLHRVKNASELEAAIRAVPEPVIQELAGADEEEYTAGAVVFDHSCKACITMRRHLRDGNTYRAFVDQFPDLQAQVSAIASTLSSPNYGGYGPLNLQFRVSEGKVRVFEINARFSGTTPLRARAGFNEVEMVIRKVLWNEEVLQPPITPCAILRHWEETVVPPDQILPPERC